ncbi:hypothetical protein RYX36_027382, partial [Vicia faba]
REKSRTIFEAKTIQTTVILVLSALKWRMHLVTPISFFEPLLEGFDGRVVFTGSLYGVVRGVFFILLL